MKLLCVFIAFVLSFFIGQSIVIKLYVFSYRRRLFDSVDARKTHTGLIPRIGGMAFLPTQCSIFLLIIIILRHFNVIQVDYQVLSQFLLLIMGLGILFVTGIVDDFVGVYYKWKFAAQFVAALLLPITGLWIHHLDGLLWMTVLPGWFGILLTICVVVFIINAFNMIDGLDGLCSGLTILACTVFGTLFFRHESWLPVIFSFITVGALAPFFYYNVYGKTKRKRRIFMGDTGSMTLGLTVAFLAIRYTSGDPSEPSPDGNLLVAFSPVLVPMFDVVRVVAIRFINRKPLFLPDKEHIHHYFLRLGFSKTTTLFSILGIAFGFIVFNMCLSRFVFNNHNIILILDAIIYFGGLWLLGRVKHPRVESVTPEVPIESIQHED
ncbi:MAG: undecaprenyl/decaprenyl-phosphate alpha-N-acetylglucosaminyl 1-phosphate transferase [Tannerella sp.]|jgi:UDP-N-acetylmuramyl pentapeptide phosphotransferase/UDP-N-acetylglucosamine-1-phosphate transferase|nr:undecaprenyl/decaprenyl-phosphate alpha-N-acetylglucosaminyl 1-phosphate transferase [Tannerella sp.]